MSSNPNTLNNLTTASNLNAKQDNSVADRIIDKLKNGQNIFLTGGAGVGKTYTTNIVKRAFNPIMLAPTGIAAAHIYGGETIHSFFGFPIDKEAGLKKLSESSVEEWREILQKYNLLIIDEISMVNEHLLAWIDQRFEETDITMPILIVGDFYQLPPVIDEKKGEELVYAFETEFWKKHNFETVELTKIHRTDDIEFATVLNQLRVGDVTPEAKKMLEELSNHPIDEEYTYLYSTNNKAFKHNKKMLDKIEKPYKVFEIKEEFLGEEKDRYEFDIKRKALKPRFEDKLFLKDGALVMFTFNKYKKDEDGKKQRVYYNGEKGYLSIRDDKLIVNGIVVEPIVIDIKKYKKVKDEDGKERIEAVTIGRISQYPIKPAYAITIHKSQGMSINGLYVDLTHIWAPGQSYVALSRAMNPDRTTVRLHDYKSTDELFFASDTVKEFYRHKS